MNPMITKNLKFIVPGVLLLAVAAWIFWPAKNAKVPTPTKTTKVEQINQLPLEKRPYVTMYTRTDGKEINLTVDKVTDATSMEYELEYYDEDRTFIEGAFGTVDFSKDSLPVTKQLLLGTCSKNVCRYHDFVSGGSATLRFDGGSAAYVLKTDFNLQLQGDKEGVFGSKDAKVTLEVGRTGLPQTTYVMIASTMGLPDAIPAGTTVLSGPYAFLSASSPTLKQATITFKGVTEPAAKILFWDGKSWKELKTTVADNEASASATALGTFVLVK